MWLDGLRVPRDGEPRPDRITEVPELVDTRGGWRAAHRPQDPAKDPREPYGSESSSVGSDHAWSGCTMAAGAVAYAYEAHYAGHDDAPWGGDMRHHQDDMDGGTDLGDLRTAWSRYGGLNLTIQSGSGWSAVAEAHQAGRAIVIQGEGDCPGSGTFTGGHACAIGPETDGQGRWLWSDPVTTAWQWVTPGSIKAWAERLSSGVLFGVTRAAAEVDVGVNELELTAWTAELGDLAAGAKVLNLDGSARLTASGPRSVSVLAATTTPGGTAARLIVWTAAAPTPDLLLMTYTNQLANLRPASSGGGSDDVDAAIQERDAEWEEWVLAGAPNQPQD